MTGLTANPGREEQRTTEVIAAQMVLSVIVFFSLLRSPFGSLLLRGEVQ